jgi:hypothetical protein
MEATLMRLFKLTSTGILLLLFGAVVPAYAQQEQHQQETKAQKQEQKAKPEKQQQDKSAKQEHQQQAKGQQEQQQKRQQADKSAKQEHQQEAKGQQEQKQQQQEAKTTKQEHDRQVKGQQEQQRQEQHQQASRNSEQEHHQHEGEQRAAWQGHRAQNWKSEHRDWRERGGYNGYRIPEDRYRGNFGPDHAFRIYSNPVVIIEGYPRFQYGGFWFGAVDPWPEYWAVNWYDDDDVYIIYSDDGYYVYNRRYPRDRIAIQVYVD